MLIPVLVFSLAAIGLNILTGYTGLISLGTAGFMGVGAYGCYKLSTFFPGINIIVLILGSGFIAAAIGVLFGLPSLRIKGFYLAVATLAAQFFLSWAFIRIPWLYNYNVSGAIEVPTRTLFGVPVTGPTATATTRYLVVLSIVVAMTWIASNLVHGRIGRMWMAVRDMDIAAELIGIKLYQTKLLAFAVSSFYAGVAGAMMIFLWIGSAEPDSFNINQSFLILFMVIIGGLGSMIGSFFGAAFIWALPIVLRAAPEFLGIADQRGDPRACPVHDRRRAHHLLPDRRAARAGAAVADRETETQGVAVSVLMVHTQANSRSGADNGPAGRDDDPAAEPPGSGTPERSPPRPARQTKGGTRCNSSTSFSAPPAQVWSAPRRSPPTAQAQDSIYVPLLTYRTGAFAGGGIPIANGMNDYLTHAQRTRRRHRRRQDRRRGMRDRLRHQAAASSATTR